MNRHYLAFSIVASNLLLHGIDYQDWNKTNFNSGDTVTITDGKVLNKSISLASGVFTADITAKAPLGCGLVACFNQNATFSGNGTMRFNINAGGQSGSAFAIQGGSFTINSGISLNLTMQNASNINAFTLNNSTLNINGDLNISGNIKNAILSQGGTINIGQTTQKGRSARVGQATLNGNLMLDRGTTNINIQNGGMFRGNIQGRATLNQTIDGGTHTGNITNEDATTIIIKNNGNLQGNLTTSGPSLNLAFENNGFITGRVDSTSTTNILTNTSGTNTVNSGVSLSGSNNTININNGNLNVNGGGITTNIGQTTLDINSGATLTSNVTANGTHFTATSEGTLQGNLTSNATTSTITFTDNAKIKGNATIKGNTTNITFKNSSNIQGTLSLGARDATVNFSNNATLNHIEQTTGQSNVTFTNDAKITDGGHIIGGNIKINFKDNSQLQNNVTQSGGTSEITFSNQAKFQGNFNQSNGESNLKFQEQTSMTGGINVTDGSTDILFTGTSAMTGDLKAQGKNNKVKFTENTKLTGNLTLGSLQDSQSEGDLKGTTITGNVTGHSDVTLTVDNTTIQGQLHQSTGSLTATIKNSSKIQGGFLGNRNSINTINVTGSSITGGVWQVTGSLNFRAHSANVEGSFYGQNSTNIFEIAHSTFKTDLAQSGGSLQAEFVTTTGLQNFFGLDSSNNVLHLLDTKIQSVVQNGGGVDFNTDSDVTGTIIGSQNSQNKVTITGGNVGRYIEQNTGTLTLNLTNSDILGNDGSQFSIHINNATANLNGNATTISGAIKLVDSTTTGIFETLSLDKAFIQTRGDSSITFANSVFKELSSFTDTNNASLIFTLSKIQNIQATRGTTAFSLSNSQMTSFTGSNGDHSLSLTKSQATFFEQTGGSLTLNASGTSIIQGDITGSQNSNIIASLNDESKVTGNFTNDGTSSITMQNSTIQGNVKQTRSTMTLTGDNSKINGSYQQIGGVTVFNLTNRSSIDQGVTLNDIQSGTLNLNENSRIKQGLRATGSTFGFSLSNGSQIAGGFTQTRGEATGLLDRNSNIQGDINLSNGSTTLKLFNNSAIQGNIVATDHKTNILLDNSSIAGNLTITRGEFKLVAQNGSEISGGINAPGAPNNKTQATIQDADFTLILDTRSTFNGNITQTNNKQTIIVKQNSKLNGSITNNNVQASITASDNSDITGNINQTGGTLAFDLSRGGRLGGELFLTNVTTTLSGTGEGNSIGLGITQFGGRLTGTMNGLTLKGPFTQDGGISDVFFTNSSFEAQTNITNAESSSLTFVSSTLKGVEIRDGDNNTLKLLDNTTMTGNLIVRENSQTWLKMQDSAIEGSIEVRDNSFLTLDTIRSGITGMVDINTGGLKGLTKSTTIGGNITLTDTQSTVSFTNNSTINGDLTAIKGENKIKFNNSTIKGDISQTNGRIELDLSNGSTIGGNLTFEETIAHLTGATAGNKINGNFTSENSTLTGEISSLTLKGTFTQNKGTSNITFKDNSTFLGEVTITDANSSNLTFSQNSGIQNKINITNGTNNNINLKNNSFIKGDTTIAEGTTTITATANSSITGIITATNSTTRLNFNNSTLNGDITTNGGILNLKAQNNSNLTSNIKATDTTTKISLSNSVLSGTITQENESLTIDLKNNASFNATGAMQDVIVTNADIIINADNSYFGGNLKHENTGAQDNISATLKFLNNAIYEGSMELNKIKTEAKFIGSTLTSQSIKVTEGSFDLLYDNATAGGIVDEFIATDTSVNITSKNQSLSTIANLKVSNSMLHIEAHNKARISGNVFLENGTKATYLATTNGIINLNTKINDNASSLEATLSGGLLFGNIQKDITPTANVILKTIGENGGRWAITGDSQISSLNLSNQEELPYSKAIFGSVFDNPLSFVDFTMNLGDFNASSRVGNQIIRPPEVKNGEPLPTEPLGQTYVRQLKTSSIAGNNGLFRVYTDLGTNLSDNILAQQASGNHVIQVIYRADTFREIGDSRIVVAKVTDATTQVSFKGTQSEVGLTRYDTEIIKENALDGQGFEWIIGQATESDMSYASKIIASILQSQYRLFYIESDGLTQRLGDLERIKRDQSFWIRGFIGQGDKKVTPISVGVTDRYFSLWSGFDYNSFGLTGHNFVGGFFNYSGIDTESKDYVGKSSNIALGFYNVFKANSGFYVDLLAKYIFTQSIFDISNYSLAKNKPSFNNHKFLANLEMGHTFYLGEKRKSMYLQPLFQATSGRIGESSFDFIDVSGEIIHSKMGASTPAIFKTGLWFGKSFGENIRANLKIGSFFAYDVNSGGRLDFADSNKQVSYKTKGDFRMIFSGHGDFAFSDNFRLYTSLDTSFFGSYNTVFNFNLGLRFAFGKRNNIIPYVPVAYNPNPEAPIINDDRRTIPTIQTYTKRDINKNYAGKPRDRKRYNPSVQLAPNVTTPPIQSTPMSQRTSTRDRPVEFIDQRRNR